MSESTAVGNVMKRSLVAVSPRTAAAEALAQVLRAGACCAVVVEDGYLLGVAYQRDLRFAVKGALVCECATPPMRIPAQTTLAQAAGLMEELGVSCLPVMAGGLLLGVITRDELAAHGVVIRRTGTEGE